MIADIVMCLIGAGATGVCAIAATLVIPGLTVLVNRTVALQEARSQLLQLLNECEETALWWVHTTDQERWERGRLELWQLFLAAADVRVRLPVIGGGKTRSAMMKGEGVRIGELQHILNLMVSGSEGAGPTAEQKEARKKDLDNLKHHSRHLRDPVNDLESTKALRSHVWTEVCQVYCSIWRMLFAKS